MFPHFDGPILHFDGRRYGNVRILAELILQQQLQHNTLGNGYMMASDDLKQMKD